MRVVSPANRLISVFDVFAVVVISVVISVVVIVVVLPRADLHVMGMLRFVFDINQLSLPTPFHSVLVSLFLSLWPF